MRISRLQRVVVTATLVAAVFMPGAPFAIMQSAAEAASVSIAALAAANVGKGAGSCSTVNSSDNSLGGSQFNGSCTGYRGGAEYWCADFAKWIWQNAAGSTINTAGLDASAASFYSYGSRNGTLHTSPSYQPQPGDAIVYDYDGQGHADHVGLVTSVSSDGAIMTVNGDWNGEAGYGMAKFAETSEVVVTTLQPNEVAVGSTPSSMDGMTISAYVTPVTISAAVPDFYYANVILPEELYASPTYPKELAIDNHDGIAIRALDAWGPEIMIMTGVLTYDECQPDCAAGPTVTFPVQVIATTPQTCTLQVDQQGSTLPDKAYVYSDITVKALSGNPPANLVGNSVFKACNATLGQQPPTEQGPAPFAVTSSSPTSGPASGGTLIVIHGSGFSSVTKVVMNSIEPPLPEGSPNYFLQNLHPRFSVVSDSEIDVTTTAGAAGFTYEIDFITPTNEYFRNTFPGIPLFTYQ
jgi:CHAP domain/IPT/TIG domain